MKKNRSKDYWNYDYIELTSKTKHADEVVKAYAVFGWEEVDRYADRTYFDVLHLSFRRSRKIQNKDQLQYLQVTYERSLNKSTEYEYKKHERSSIVLTLLMLVWFFAISTCLYFFTNSQILGVKIVTGILTGALVISTYFISAYVKNLRKKENKKCLDKQKEIDKVLQSVLDSARSLGGEDCEK